MSNVTNWMVKDIVLKNYFKGCLEADIDSFKKDWRLTPIFEHTPLFIAQNYIKKVRQVNPDLLEMDWTNDKIGGPDIKDIEGWKGSTATAQYIGVLSNLIELYGSLDDLTIVEIGGGYGGQALTILDKFCPKKYTIIDFPEVNELQKKVLGDRVYITDKILKTKCDLLISNYALSEIPEQSYYLPLIEKAKHGYVTCNTNIVEIEKAKRIKDIEGERETNFILTW